MTRIYRPYPVAIPPHGCYTAIVANAAVRHSLDSLSVLVMPIHFVIRRQWYRSDAQPCRLSSLSRRCKSCSGKCASGRGMHIDSLHGSLQFLLTFDMPLHVLSVLSLGSMTRTGMVVVCRCMGPRSRRFLRQRVYVLICACGASIDNATDANKALCMHLCRSTASAGLHANLPCAPHTGATLV
jgi:hypothetical protein